MPERDPFAAIPVISRGTWCEPAPSGDGLIVRRTDEPKGALSRFLQRKLAWQRQRVFEFDAVGACYFEQVDGHTPLSEISRILCERFELPPDRARRAVIEFTAVLMRRGLLGLRLEPE
jgi:hypothetical protein